MKKLFAALALLSLGLFWACHLDPEDNQTLLDVKGDSAWSEFDSLNVVLLGPDSSTLDTLFHGKLTSISQLNHLSGDHLPAGEAHFRIVGYLGGAIVFEQIRRFNPATGHAVVETTLAVGKQLDGLVLKPDSLSLFLGGAAGKIILTGTPAYARPDLEWLSAGDAIEMQVKAGAWEAILEPKKEGDTKITVHPRSDHSLERTLVVHVVKDEPVLDVHPARTFVAIGAKVTFSVESRQAYGSLVDFRWNLDGDEQWDDSLTGPWKDAQVELPEQSRVYDKAGSYHARFRALDSEGNYGEAEAVVEVGERKPTVRLGPKDTVISIRDQVVFNGDIQESGGRLASYTWDFNGDGNPEDSASLSDSTARLKVSRVFADTGTAWIVLRARDAEGKTGTDSTRVTVRQDPPVVNAGPDTAAKSRVALQFQGSATQAFGTIVMYKWDYDGDGTYDDSSATLPTKSHAYPAEGVYKARFYARDDDDNVATATRNITINDAQIAILSKHADTVVSIMDAFTLNATVRNEDSKVLQYGWDYNGDDILDDSSTSSAPSILIANNHRYPQSGLFKTVLKVKDILGKTLTDTVKVEVLLDPPKIDLGRDTVLQVGSQLRIKLPATDRFGSIVKREIDIGDSKVFTLLSQPETTFTLPVSKGTIAVIAKVTDDDGQADLDTMEIKVIYSPENRLATLFLSPPGTSIKPEFFPDTLIYSGMVGNTQASIVIGAAAQHAKASVSVNGKALSPSVTSVSVDLVVGLNSIPIVVMAQDSTTRTYTLNFRRLPSTNANLSGISSAPSLSPAPAFSPGVTVYAATVQYGVSTILLGAVAQDRSATVSINGKILASAVATESLNLAVGLNAITIVVTAQDSSAKTYTLNVTRLASGNAALSGLTVSPGPGLTPAFSPATLGYFLTLPDSIDTLRVTPFAADSLASLTLNGTAAASGITSPAIPIPAGTTTLTVVVTSPDNVTKNSYTITIKRASWQLLTPARFSPPRSAFQSLTVGNGVVYAAFIDSANSEKPLVLKKGPSDTAWTSLGASSLAEEWSYNIKLGIRKGVLFMQYFGPSNNYSGIILKKFMGGAWVPIGDPYTIGPMGAFASDFDFDTMDTAYFINNTVRGHYNSFDNTTLLKFNGSKWISVARSVASDSTNFAALEINPVSGTKYLSWLTSTSGSSRYVANIDTLGTSKPTGVGSDTVAKPVLLPLGGAGWPAAFEAPAFGLDPTGIPYFVYAEPANNRIAVKRFTGTWVDVGTTGFSKGAASNLDIAFQGTTPIVAYRDAELKTVVVRQWNGSTWIPLGTEPVSAVDVGRSDLATEGTSAWIGYGDASAGGRGTVNARIVP